MFDSPSKTMPDVYEPSSVSFEDPEIKNAVALREALAHHEAAVKAVGLLFLISGILGGVLLLFLLWLLIESPGAHFEPRVGAASLFFVFSSAALILIGLNLRRFEPVVKVPATLLAALMLPGVPMGTLFGGYLLWLLHGSGGQTVMTKEYQRITKITPRVGHRSLLLSLLLISIIVFGSIMALGTYAYIWIYLFDIWTPLRPQTAMPSFY